MQKQGAGIDKDYVSSNIGLTNESQRGSLDVTPNLSISVPREPVDGVGAETDDGHHADHRVRKDGTWFHELPAGRPDCLAERR